MLGSQFVESDCQKILSNLTQINKRKKNKMSTKFIDDFDDDGTHVIEAEHVKQYAEPVNDLESGKAFYRVATGTGNPYQVSFRKVDSTGGKGHYIEPTTGSDAPLSAGQMVVFKANVSSPSGGASLSLLLEDGSSGVSSGNIPLNVADNQVDEDQIKAGQIIVAIYNDTSTPRFDVVGVSVESGGLTSPVDIVDGGTGSTTQAGAQVALNVPPSSRTISTTSPLLGGGDLSTNRTLSIPQANSSQDGYLASSDFGAFSAKQNALTQPGDVPGLTTALNGKQNTDTILNQFLTLIPTMTSGQVVGVDNNGDLVALNKDDEMKLQINDATDFGNGANGAVTYSSDTTVKNDVNATTITVNQGATITLGWNTSANRPVRLRATTSINVIGAVSVAGSDAYGSGGGAGALAGGSSGATANGTSNPQPSGTSLSNSLGGKGGQGGGQSTFSRSAGLGGAISSRLSEFSPSVSELLVGLLSGSLLKGGSGGGAGGSRSSGSNIGGHGGGGGGVAILAAPSISGGGIITAAGGKGSAPASDSSRKGSGGGGGGGVLVLVSRYVSPSLTLTAAGGAAIPFDYYSPLNTGHFGNPGSLLVCSEKFADHPNWEGVLTEYLVEES